ncbi:hypothetical protein [Afifella marina]|nr:hypothetical protein [Afifella marina]
MSQSTAVVPETTLSVRIGALEERFDNLLREGAGMSREDVEAVRDHLTTLRRDAAGLECGPELVINTTAKEAVDEVEKALTALTVCRTTLIAVMLSEKRDAAGQAAYWLKGAAAAIAKAQSIACAEPQA